MITAAGHRYGWPVAEGGSRSITDAMAAMLLDHGGKIDTGVRVRTASEIPDADVVLLDVNPGGALEILGDRLPGRVARRSEEHTSELQSLMRISYAVFCLKKKKI